MASTKARTATVGILWRSDPRRDSMVSTYLLDPLARAFAEVNIAANAVVYSDEAVEDARRQMLQLDGVLVWVDPVTKGGNRTTLDALLRDVASRGVWVSAHPDAISKMGTKEVLYRTRDLGWGTDDVHLYRTAKELREQLPARLASGGSRVLKPNRGNGGIGVWRVELLDPQSSRMPERDADVRVQEGRRDSTEVCLPLDDFLHRCDSYFDGTYPGPELVVDQPFQVRLGEGMIRCYLCDDRVAGFGHQLVTALLPVPPGADGAHPPQPGPRIMHSPSAPQFAELKTMLESDWLPGMQRLLDIDRASLPAIWDADFLYGPKTASGEDTYVLCEINVSGVFPFPEQALGSLVRTAAARLVRPTRAT